MTQMLMLGTLMKTWKHQGWLKIFFVALIVNYCISDDDDDEDDDELELQKELERIKEERAALQAKKEQEEAEILEKMKKESAVKGNPLLDLDPGSAKVIGHMIAAQIHYLFFAEFITSR